MWGVVVTHWLRLLGSIASTAWSLASAVGDLKKLQGLLWSSRTLLQICLVDKQMNDMLLFTWSQAMAQTEESRVRTKAVEHGGRGQVLFLKYL